MSRSMSVAEARTKLPRLLHDVEQGETVSITRRGRPVAVVLSAAAYQQLSSNHGAFRSLYHRWRESVDQKDLDLPRDYFRLLRDPPRHDW